MPWKTMAATTDVKRAFLEDWSAGKPVADLVEHYGIKKTAAYKLIARAQAEGVDAAVVDRSRAPHHVPNRISDDALELILCLRAEFPKYGPKKLHRLFRTCAPNLDVPSRASFANVLRNYGLSQTYHPRRWGPPTTRLFEAREPNDVWAADHKGMMSKLGVEPLTIMDAASRFWLVCSPFAAKTYRDTRDAFERAFNEFGAPLVVRVDGGAPWSSASPSRLTAFSAWLISLAIEVEVVARCQQNGRVERLHGTMQSDMNRPGVEDIRVFFEREREIYNQVRPHEALDMDVPSNVYVVSKRQAKEQKPNYEDCDEVRNVDRRGYINWRGELLYISEGLVHRAVGLRRLDLNRVRVRYYHRFVGVIDEARWKLLHA